MTYTGLTPLSYLGVSPPDRPVPHSRTYQFLADTVDRLVRRLVHERVDVNLAACVMTTEMWRDPVRRENTLEFRLTQRATGESRHWRERVPPEVERDLTAMGPEQIAMECRRAFMNALDDAEIERARLSAREALLEVQRLTPDGTRLAQAHDHYNATMEMLDRHRGAAAVMRVPVAELLNPARNMTATEIRARQEAYNRSADEFLYNFLTVTFGNDNPYIRDPKAEARAEQLLCDNLTPEQLDCYKQNNYFYVTGSNSGRRYRIRQGRQMNIDEMMHAPAQAKTVLRVWCFLPEGYLAAGDCMLAQKIALENDELAALHIANLVSGPPRDLDAEMGAACDQLVERIKVRAGRGLPI